MATETTTDERFTAEYIKKTGNIEQNDYYHLDLNAMALVFNQDVKTQYRAHIRQKYSVTDANIDAELEAMGAPIRKFFIDNEFFNISFSQIVNLKKLVWVEVVPEDGKKAPKPTLDKNYRSLIERFLEMCVRFIATKDTIFAFNGKCYSRKIEEVIIATLEILYNELDIAYRDSDKNEIVKVICARNQIDPQKLNNYPDIIPFENGWYNIKKGKLETPNPDYCLTYTIPHTFMPNVNQADCATILRFFADFIPNQAEREWFLIYLAYCLTPRVDIQRGVIIPGTDEGHNGKSVVTELIRVIWKGISRSISLQDLKLESQRVELRGILVNIYPDLPGTAIEDESVAKVCIADETITGRELYHQPTEWHNTTRHIFGCNKIPLAPYETTNAFYKRWKIVHAPSTFKFENDPAFDSAKHKKAIPAYFKLLEPEIPSFVSLLVQKYLPHINKLRPYDITETKRLWRTYSDNVLQFYETCKIGPEYEIPCSKLYQEYTQWCRKGDISPASQGHFGKVLANQGIERTRTRDNADLVWVYRGIDAPELVQTTFDVNDLLRGAKKVSAPPNENV